MNKFNTDHLSNEAYQVTQKKATEPPFSGDLLKEGRDGVYRCIVCDNPLFSSETKYDSGSGWPSFAAAVNEKLITLKKDKSIGMERTEVICSNCGAHLGHVFDDGPEKLADGSPAEGKRYCINSCALNFSTDNAEN